MGFDWNLRFNYCWRTLVLLLGTSSSSSQSGSMLHPYHHCGRKETRPFRFMCSYSICVPQYHNRPQFLWIPLVRTNQPGICSTQEVVPPLQSVRENTITYILEDKKNRDYSVPYGARFYRQINYEYNLSKFIIQR